MKTVSQYKIVSVTNGTKKLLSRKALIEEPNGKFTVSIFVTMPGATIESKVDVVSGLPYEGAAIEYIKLLNDDLVSVVSDPYRFIEGIEDGK